MKTLVTGATGFVGANLVRELLKTNCSVRALVRPNSNRVAIANLKLEMAEGDLLNEESLRFAVRGCDTIYHVAALYSYWVPTSEALMYQTNVEGTRNLLRIAKEEGVSRVVYTSSSATIGLGKGQQISDEQTPLKQDEIVSVYKESKYVAEQVALEANRQGLPVVIVNPTTPMGAWDVKPTPTGRLVIDFLKGRMFGCLNTGLNIVHVRDVARGHILAMDYGQPGGRYILGNQNMSLREIFAAIGLIAGRRPPKWIIPYGVALAYAHAAELVDGKIFRRTPGATVDQVRLSRKYMYYSSEKAKREFNMPQTPTTQAFEDSVHWFQEHGYV